MELIVPAKPYLLWLAMLVPAFELYASFELYAPATVTPRIALRVEHHMEQYMISSFTLLFGLFLIARAVSPLVFYRKAFVINIVAAALYVANHYFRVVSLDVHRWLSHVLWLSMVLSSLILFLKPPRLQQVLNTQRAPLYFLLVALTVQLFYYICENTGSIETAIWNNFLAYYTVGGAHFILDAMGFGLTPLIIGKFNKLQTIEYELPPYTDNHQMAPHLMDINIWWECSGLEGVLLFVTIFSLMLMTDYALFTRRKIVIAYILGTFYMLTLNIARIVLFFALGVYFAHHSESKESEHFIIQLFHSNIGWVIYLCGIGVFLTAFFKAAKKTPMSLQAG